MKHASKPDPIGKPVSRLHAWVRRVMDKALALWDWLLKKWEPLRQKLSPILDLFSGQVMGLAAQTAFFLAVSLLPFFLFLLSVLHNLQISLPSESLDPLLPESIKNLIFDTLNLSPRHPSARGNLSFVSLIISVWMGSNAVWAMMRGIYQSFSGRDDGPPLIGRFIAIAFTIVFTLLIGISLSLLVFGDRVLMPILSQGRVDVSLLYSILSWTAVALGLLLFLMTLYYFTPGFSRRFWSLFPGAAAACGGWLAVSLGFEFYVVRIARLSDTYGILGVFLGLLFWLYAISLLTLLGARLSKKKASNTANPKPNL